MEIPQIFSLARPALLDDMIHFSVFAFGRSFECYYTRRDTSCGLLNPVGV